MPALYTITTRASGTILTAAIYNADHQNHVNNGDAQHLGGFSSNTSQMRTQTSPGDVGTESLALSVSDELARIRYMIAQLRGSTFWYGTSSIFNSGPGSYNYVRNSDILTLSRQGQAAKSYTASAGDPYTADQWYVHNNANQAMTVGPGPAISGCKAFGSMYVQRTAGQTGVGQMWVGQPFSLPQFVSLLGTQICYSFYILFGANISPTSIGSAIFWGTGANAAKITGMTGLTSFGSASTPTAPSTAVRVSGTGVLPANATQMELNIAWTPVGTAGAQDTIYLTGFKLEPGSSPTTYWPPDPYAELAELQTWYYKTFQLGVAPAQNAGLAGMFTMPTIAAPAAANNGCAIRWPTRMLKIPTVTIYNPAAVNAQFRNTDLPVDHTATAASNIDESGCCFSFVVGAGSAAGHKTGGHITAEAGI